MKIPSSDREKLWCQYFLEGCNKKEAAQKAGYAESSSAVTGHQLSQRYEDYIFSESGKMLKGAASLGINVISRLASSAKQESVQLKAATQLVMLSGHKPADKLEITDKRSEEEIDAQLTALLGDSASALVSKTLN